MQKKCTPTTSTSTRTSPRRSPSPDHVGSSPEPTIKKQQLSYDIEPVIPPTSTVTFMTAKKEDEEEKSVNKQNKNKYNIDAGENWSCGSGSNKEYDDHTTLTEEISKKALIDEGFRRFPSLTESDLGKRCTLLY